MANQTTCNVSNVSPNCEWNVSLRAKPTSWIIASPSHCKCLIPKFCEFVFVALLCHDQLSLQPPVFQWQVFLLFFQFVDHKRLSLQSLFQKSSISRNWRVHLSQFKCYKRGEFIFAAIGNTTSIQRMLDHMNMMISFLSTHTAFEQGSPKKMILITTTTLGSWVACVHISLARKEPLGVRCRMTETFSTPWFQQELNDANNWQIISEKNFHKRQWNFKLVLLHSQGAVWWLVFVWEEGCWVYCSLSAWMSSTLKHRQDCSSTSTNKSQSRTKTASTWKESLPFLNKFIWSFLNWYQLSKSPRRTLTSKGALDCT